MITNIKIQFIKYKIFQSLNIQIIHIISYDIILNYDSLWGFPPGVLDLHPPLSKSPFPLFFVYEWPSQQRIHNKNNKGCTGQSSVGPKTQKERARRECK